MSWTRFFHRRHWDEERARELQAYLEIETDENITRGMSPEEARYAAHRKLGNLTLIREEIYRMNSLGWLETLWQDVRYSARILARNPGFTAVATITLALGIGANTAIFSVVNAVLLRALPYKDPGRLVWITDFIPRQNNALVFDSDYFAWVKQNQVFEGMAAYGTVDLTLTGVGDTERLEGARVTVGSFSVLGVAPTLGRTFLAEEDLPGGPQVCVLSHELWQRRFGADASIVGKAIALNGKPYTVLGVMPATFEFAENFKPALYVPFDLRETVGVAPGEMHMCVSVIARLKPGITIQGAESNLALINRGLEASYKGGYAKMMAGARAQVISLQAHLVANVRLALLVLLGAVGFVLLIACANVANLQLARAVRQQKEIAIRTALGAGRWRLARQLLTESLLLAALGGAAGVGLAAWGVSVLRTLGPAKIPRLADIHVDYRVLLFTALVAIVTGILFGLVSVFTATKTHPSESLKEGGLRLAFGLGRQRTRGALVVLQLALALVLLTGAGLLMRSFVRLTGTDLGFNPHNLLTARVALPDNRYQRPDQQRAFFQDLLERLRTLPGASSAEAVAVLPLTGFMMSAGFEIEGRPPRPEVNSAAAINIVSPGYLHAIGVPLISGRTFTPQDSADAPKVIILNQACVRTFFSDESPIGKRIQIAGMDWATIVGVVGDLRQAGLASRPQPEIFMPYLQMSYADMAVVVRSEQDPLTLVRPLRSQVKSIDKSLPIFDVATMDQLLGDQVASRRFNMTLLGLFAFLALALAAVGIYGVMTYTVTQRTHEIGIRMALGADQHDVLDLVLWQGIVLAALGVGIGLVGALALTRFLSSLLYGVRPTDPATFIIVSALLGGVALLATYLPALRATKVDPLVTLRHE
jgi:putative ABC transport system permease protein